MAKTVEVRVKVSRMEWIACLLILIGAFPLPLQVSGQPDVSDTATLTLGTRSIRVPSPSGLVDGGTRFDHLKSRFVVTESPGNDMLAVFIPESIVPALEKGKIPPYDRWAKVSVLTKLRATDVNAETFRRFADEFEKMSPEMIDEKSPAFQNSIANARKGLSGLLGQKVVINLSEPKSLGVFDRQANVWSMLIVSNLTDSEGTRPLLGSLTLLRVKQRLLFVYAYSKLTNENDANDLRRLSKKWSADILAANR